MGRGVDMLERMLLGFEYHTDCFEGSGPILDNCGVVVWSKFCCLRYHSRRTCMVESRHGNQAARTEVGLELAIVLLRKLVINERK